MDTAKEASQAPAQSAAPAPTTADADSGILSAKDLKALKKAEKAAKRAAQKVAAGLPAVSDPRQAKQGQQQQQQQSQQGQQGQQYQASSDKRSQQTPRGNVASRDGGSAPVGGAPGSAGSISHNAAPSRLTLFGHLEQTRITSAAEANKEVHPSVLYLAMQFASFHVAGSAERCRAMLLAFQDVIRDYKTPEGTTLSRNLTNHLSHQIDHLKTARPLSIAMGNSIRWLKQEITNLGIDVSDAEAKDHLHDQIDNFIRVRLDYADRVIVENAINNINDGDTILTYSSSKVVLSTLIAAHKQGKRFKVVVVDSRPLFEGKSVAKILSKAGISTSYTLLNGLTYVLKDVKTVMVGAHAMLSNGMLYSRVGTAAVALAASSRNIPVVVLCQSIKFSDKVLLDSFTFNELGSPDALINLSRSMDKLPVPSAALKNWKTTPNLHVTHVLYDIAPPDFIKKVVTEFGSLPPSSVPVILREYKSGY
ncbi:uncharacterized protein SAPINGB_P002793 [Magnusiomyces paraingens]|uniref:Translation initiation factor eIF2B subunit delta n=1 Tax=Magnusiomyces paraingens TaxID=2606893 RepID=A0A5E8BIS2_9ASCO|nr:uncharacterized protein SAPINGB_P002793 [Saprochaete ingens]VVT50527.1 unnamed protein product [Saprochaete ingens]